MVRASWSGHPRYQKKLVRGLVFVHLRWHGDPGYKKKYISKKIKIKRLSLLRDHGDKKMYKLKKTKKY